MSESMLSTVSIIFMYKLTTKDGTILSNTKGTLGGHRKLKIYGKLDCYNALQWIDKGHYISERVFFKDEQTAIEAGYRPCRKCTEEIQ